MIGDITAIRLRARPASDTEGLPVGAVVPIFWDGLGGPYKGFAQWRASGWGSASNKEEEARIVPPLRPGDRPIWRYLLVNLAKRSV